MTGNTQPASAASQVHDVYVPKWKFHNHCSWATRTVQRGKQKPHLGMKFSGNSTRTYALVDGRMVETTPQEILDRCGWVRE